jgi:hypothetical protein
LPAWRVENNKAKPKILVSTKGQVKEIQVNALPQPDDSPPTDDRQKQAYRWAFSAFAILFLLTIIAGLVNYLGTWLKYRV